MANPAKRRIDGDQTASEDGPESSAGIPGGASERPAKVVPPKAKAKAKAGDRGAPARYTPTKTTSKGAGPSPRWVPVLMFALWGVGLLLIVLNYMGVLPGSEDGGNGWYLVGGLASILAGIMVATQYR